MRDPQQQEQLERLLTQDVYRAAWNYSYRLSKRREDAEDLLQEALVHALRKLDQLKDEATFKSWLLSIVRTRFLNGLRAQKSRPQMVDEIPHLGGKAGPGSGGLSPELQTALLKLPERQREILEMYYMQGLNMDETGAVLGIASSIVRQRLFRARRSIKKLLEVESQAERSQKMAKSRLSE
jgi:RNA polymerase sigma-70 factor (ECF subfamily)